MAGLRWLFLYALVSYAPFTGMMGLAASIPQIASIVDAGGPRTLMIATAAYFPLWLPFGLWAGAKARALVNEGRTVDARWAAGVISMLGFMWPFALYAAFAPFVFFSSGEVLAIIFTMAVLTSACWVTAAWLAPKLASRGGAAVAQDLDVAPADHPGSHP